MPSRTSPQFQAERSCSSSSTMAPSRATRASKRAPWKHIRASKAWTAGTSPAGCVAQVAADRHVAVGGVAALTEQEVDDREDRVQPGAEPGRIRRVKIQV